MKRKNITKFIILTTFPKIFTGFLTESIIGRTVKKGLIEIKIINIRDFATDKHKTVDDRPFGGGPGMVMKPDVAERTINFAKRNLENPYVILLTPQGKKFDHNMSKKLAHKKNIILVCGHYEGFDERIRKFADEEISIGDYVLTGGEVPAMILADAIMRQIPGVLGKIESTKEESFSEKYLEYPQYTRPSNYKGMRVPEVLLSGDHKKIKEWREQQSIKRTKIRRKDLLK